MKIITSLAFLADLVVIYALPAPTSNTWHAKDIVTTYYPNGLPAGLYPGAELFSRAGSFEKRAPQTPVSATITTGPTAETPVGVYACSDINFNGFCVYIRSRPGECVQAPSASGPANDATSSVGPDRPWQCRFYVNFRCDEDEGYFDLQYPGISDLSLTPYNDKISSYRCA